MELENFVFVGFSLERYHVYWVPGCHCIGCFVHFFELGYAHRLDVMGCQFFADVLFWYVGGGCLLEPTGAAYFPVVDMCGMRVWQYEFL
jgi:hypothetical protein